MKLTFISVLAALSIRPILGAAKNKRRLRKAKRNGKHLFISPIPFSGFHSVITHTTFASQIQLNQLQALNASYRKSMALDHQIKASL